MENRRFHFSDFLALLRSRLEACLIQECSCFEFGKRNCVSKVSKGVRYHRRERLAVCAEIQADSKHSHDRWIDVIGVFGPSLFSRSHSSPGNSFPLLRSFPFLPFLSSQHIPKIKVFLVCQILESKFVSFFFVNCLCISPPVFSAQNKVQDRSGYYDYAVTFAIPATSALKKVAQIRISPTGVRGRGVEEREVEKVI